jgi:hypothetical protein
MTKAAGGVLGYDSILHANHQMAPRPIVFLSHQAPFSKYNCSGRMRAWLFGAGALLMFIVQSL